MKNRQQQLSEKAHEERRRCRDWLLKFMQDDQPKFLTKDELREAAMRELNVSKLSFDMGGLWRSKIPVATTGMSRCADDRGPETSPIAVIKAKGMNPG
jgi:hypothetical protein